LLSGMDGTGLRADDKIWGGVGFFRDGESMVDGVGRGGATGNDKSKKKKRSK